MQAKSRAKFKNYFTSKYYEILFLKVKFNFFDLFYLIEGEFRLKKKTN